MLDEPSCSFLVQAHILSGLCWAGFGLLNLVEVLSDSGELFEDCMLFRGHSMESEVRCQSQPSFAGCPDLLRTEEERLDGVDDQSIEFGLVEQR